MISGTARGHNLKTVKGNSTRPTSDKVKGALFNILANLIPGSTVLDLFAGTGSLGIEALSRGADFAIFVDKSSESVRIIKENLTHTKLSDKALVLSGDSFSVLKKLSNESRKFDIVFLDPPYRKNLVVESLNYLSNSDIMNNNAIVAAEHDVNDAVLDELGRFKLVKSRKYGDTVLSFYGLI